MTTAKSTFLEPALLWLVLSRCCAVKKGSSSSMLLMLLVVSWLTDHTPIEALSSWPPPGDQRGTQSPEMVALVMFSTRALARRPSSLPQRSLKAKFRRG